MGQKRLRRTERKLEGERESIRLNEHHLNLLQEIDFHGFMGTRHVHQSFPTKHPNLLNRHLALLFHNEYLGRKSEPTDIDLGWNGPPPVFYWITARGKYTLALHDRPYTGDVDYEPDIPKTYLIPHHLCVTDFMVKIKMYCLRHNIRFISHYEILENATVSTQKLKHPFKFKVNARYIDKDVELLIEPDKVFGTELQDGRKKYYALEMDMGTEPQKRTTAFTSSIYKKAVGYVAIQETGLHKTHLNIPGFRVPFVTTKNTLRARNIMETTREVKATKGFLFGVLREIEDPFTYEWLTGQNVKIDLLS